MSYIQGANSFYMFTLNNKNYTLIGDQHNIKGVCSDNVMAIPINTLLRDWLTYNNKNGIMTDFYIEEKFTRSNVRKQKRKERDEQNTQNWLETVIFEMEPCLVKDKSNCPLLPNVHSHYVDIRYVDEYGLLLDPFNMDLVQRYLERIINNNVNINDIKHDILLIFDIYMKHYIALINMMIKPLLKKIVIYLKNNYYNTFKVPVLRNIFFNQLNDIVEKISVTRDNVLMHRTAAQLKKLSNQDVEKVIRFIYSKAHLYMTIFKEQYKEKLQQAEFLMQYDPSTKPLILLVDGMQGYLEYLVSLSMDAYTLGRILSQPFSSEIIVYAGYYHIEHYKEFFTTYYTISFTVNNPPIVNEQCLHIDYNFNT
jgi:hypothetical protein